jgi:hypothetical protein
MQVSNHSVYQLNSEPVVMVKQRDLNVDKFLDLTSLKGGIPRRTPDLMRNSRNNSELLFENRLYEILSPNRFNESFGN